jgi:hypothetical protein
MRRVFVDANVFLRFFTQDDEGHHEKAKALFTAADSGKIQRTCVKSGTPKPVAPQLPLTGTGAIGTVPSDYKFT